MPLFHACQKTDPLQDPVKAGMTALQNAVDGGRIVSRVIPIEDKANGGWAVIFSGGEQIVLHNEPGDAVIDFGAPVLKIDPLGHWAISYNNGSTFTLLTDKDGVPIEAEGPGGVNLPEFNTDDASIVKYMIRNTPERTLTIVLSNDSSYVFEMETKAPDKLALERGGTLSITSGGSIEMSFLVDPADAWFSLDQVRLDGADADIRLEAVEPTYDAISRREKPGVYHAIVKDTGRSADYEKKTALVIGDGVLAASDPVTIKLDSKLLNPRTGLPVVYIDTPDRRAVTSKTTWMEGATIMVVNADRTIDCSGTLSIKGRGNSTWGYPKKPYALKLDKKEKVLGMKKHKRWCLLANWMDRTLMRNAVAFEISRHTGLAWTPSGQYVELVLNGRHLGNYYLCEQIKIDENRVAIDGTDGQIFELDAYFDEVNRFRPSISKLPWNLKDPDEVTEEHFAYVRDYVEKMEKALYGSSSSEFCKYVDLESFADWWIVNELTMNWEVNHPKSCYMHLDKGGRMTAGPVWDYDWGTFLPGSTSSFITNNGLYYPQLLKDNEFVRILKSRWATFKPALESEIPAFIDSLQKQLSDSDVINSKMWPIANATANNDDVLPFNSAVIRLKKAYLDKLGWLDRQISKM